MAADSLQINAQELRGKQSVRATFRLPDEIIELLKTAADHLGVKQKSLLDQLVEDRSVLSKVAEEGRHWPKSALARRQKTFVLSRRALDMLDEISTSHGIARDLLMELSVGRLAPFVLAEQEKQCKRLILLDDINEFLADGRRVMEKADRMLDRDDRFRMKLEKLISHAEKSISDLEGLMPTKKI